MTVGRSLLSFFLTVAALMAFVAVAAIFIGACLFSGHVPTILLGFLLLAGVAVTTGAGLYMAGTRG